MSARSGGLSRCLRCLDHIGDTPLDIARRDAEHVQLYRRALTDMQDDVLVAQAEREFLRDAADAATDLRDELIRALATLHDVHHARGSRCSCGKRHCGVLRVLAEPRVSRLVVRYDEQRRTLRELRNANPELWGDSWDGIDVTLVYPKAKRKTVGRHRAS